MYDQQSASDELKALIMGRGTPAQRRPALEALVRLEIYGWNPHAFGEAVEAKGKQLLSFNGSAITPTAAFETAPFGAFTLTVVDIIDDYEQRVSPQVFSLNEAAKYLNLAPITVKYHVYEAKTLNTMKERHMLFTKAELDRFQAERPKRGWVKGRSRKTTP